MRCIRLTVTACLLLLAGAVCGAEELGRDQTRATAEDRWEITRLAVARESAASDLRFYRSLRWWTREESGAPGTEAGKPLVVQADATAELPASASGAVHILGDLATTLTVTGNSEVVVGGSVLRNGRIEADGIAVVHVQGNVDGTIACASMTAVWIGGDVRGEILTGEPSMHLHVKGDLLGSVRPISKAALLYVEAGGHVPSAVLAAIDRYRYTELEVAAGRSDLAAGIHRLWAGINGFVAVAEGGAGK